MTSRLVDRKMRFKEFAKRYPSTLFESPLRTGFNFEDPLTDNVLLNIENTEEQVLHLPAVGKYTLTDHVLNCHREIYDKSSFQDYWVSPKHLTCVEFVFKNTESGLKAGGVWQHKSYRGVAREIFFSFYLPSVDYIESDLQHSTQGEKYWKKIITRAFQLGLLVHVIDKERNETVISPRTDLNSFWGSDYDRHSCVFRVFSK